MRRMANEMANNNKYERRQEGKTKIENRESLAVWKVFFLFPSLLLLLFLVVVAGVRVVRVCPKIHYI